MQYQLKDATAATLVTGTYDEVWAYVVATYANMTMADFAANGYHIVEGA